MDLLERFSKLALEDIKKLVDKYNNKSFYVLASINELEKIDNIEFLSLYKRNKSNEIYKLANKNKVLIRVCLPFKVFPSDEEIEFAQILNQNKKVIYCLIDNTLENYNFITDIERLILEEINVDNIFSEKGLISKKVNNFEYREEQEKMAELIISAYNNNKKAIIEAGTGTGKTLAYLIPSVLFAITNKKKVVIATNTINLQEQILNKDLPLVKKILDTDFSYTLIKGRNNYLCNRLFYENYFNLSKNKDLEFFDDKFLEMKKIQEWGFKTKTGDKSELPFEVSYDIWENIQSTSELCLGSKCKYREQCFFQKARKEKIKSDIIISNHHVFFADLNIRGNTDFDAEYLILPKYDALVFDEAHNIESVARNYFSLEISRFAFSKLLGRIYSENVDNRKLVPAINRLEDTKFTNSVEKTKEFKFYIDNIIKETKKLAESSKEYYSILSSFFDLGEKTSIKKTIIPKMIKEDKKFEKFRLQKKYFEEDMNKYLKLLLELKNIIKDHEYKNDDEDNDYNIDYLNFDNHINIFKNEILTFSEINSFKDENYVYWIYINENRTNISLTAAPLEIKEDMQKDLYTNLDRIIFTSATISTNANFNYFKNSIGLVDECFEKIIKSPFNYNKQMKVFIPIDSNNDNLDFLKDANFIKNLLIKVKGRAFLLFTSYRQLNQVYYTIEKELRKNNIDVLLQGTKPRSQLVVDFKKSENPVLFATSSFWEGVDVQGEKLSTVIIFKLPFLVPTEPIVAAVSAKIEKEGKNPFYDYQVPEAIIKFKQGVGRLIRTKEDNGNIVILDSRVYSKSYGKFFLDSLPVNFKNIRFLTEEQIINTIK